MKSIPTEHTTNQIVKLLSNNSCAIIAPVCTSYQAGEYCIIQGIVLGKIINVCSPPETCIVPLA